MPKYRLYRNTPRRNRKKLVKAGGLAITEYSFVEREHALMLSAVKASTGAASQNIEDRPELDAVYLVGNSAGRMACWVCPVPYNTFSTSYIIIIPPVSLADELRHRLLEEANNVWR